MVKRRSLNSELSLCFSGSPVQCCLAAAVCISSMLSTRGTRRDVPTVSWGSTKNVPKKYKYSRRKLEMSSPKSSMSYVAAEKILLAMIKASAELEFPPVNLLRGNKT